MPPRGATSEPKLSEALYKAMQGVLDVLFAQADEDGRDISEVFHDLVPKRQLPDYYKVIKTPMAMNVVQTAVKKKNYNSFADFVRACAQIFYNAKVYNRPDSTIYEDAVTLENTLASELKKLAAANTITLTDAQLPDLGPIPPPSPIISQQPSPEPEEDSAAEDEDDEEEEERPKRRRRTKRAMNADVGDDVDAGDGVTADRVDTRRKRGRPPRVDTPMECRIKNVMRSLRKLKDQDGRLRVDLFERLPDAKMFPDYYKEIRSPIALDGIRKRIKRREYKSVEQFEADMRIMFDNAKLYNEDDSQIYKDAVILQGEVTNQAEIEKAREDSELQESMGNPQNRYNNKQTRIPLNGIEHKGEIYVVGDWVHIINPNDLSKPTVAQIFRTWQDPEGLKWINACWYYRPEQTVHQYDRKFYEFEVVKTGQYRDHQIDEVIEKCFVMFFTRYSRGRPKDIGNKQVYVCESRYNEVEKHFNKIKTWKSCIPDEVRSNDYEMTLYEKQDNLKKFPSPIAHLLPPNATEDDPLPEAKLGAENAPPIVGAVFKRAKGQNESPPPEASPPPLAPIVHHHHTPAPAPQRSVATPSGDYNENLSMTQMYKAAQTLASQTPTTPGPASAPVAMPATPTPVGGGMHRTAMGTTPAPQYTPQPSYNMTAPMLHRQTSVPYGSVAALHSPQLVHSHTMPISTQHHSHHMPQSTQHHHQMAPQPQQYQHQSYPQNVAPVGTPVTQHQYPQQAAPHIQQIQQHPRAQQQFQHQHQQQQHQQQQQQSHQFQPQHSQSPVLLHQQPYQHHQAQQQQNAQYSTPHLSSSTKPLYNPPNAPAQTFTLPDSATCHIPESVSSQFLRDSEGRMLWFTVPPLDNNSSANPTTIIPLVALSTSSASSSRKATPTQTTPVPEGGDTDVEMGDGGSSSGSVEPKLENSSVNGKLPSNSARPSSNPTPATTTASFSVALPQPSIGHSLAYLAKRNELLLRKQRRKEEADKEVREAKRMKTVEGESERKEVGKVMVRALEKLIVQMKA